MMKKVLVLLSGLFAVFWIGCSQSRPDGLPDLVPVTLSFTQDGVPLSGATVSLVDLNGTVEFTVGGTTDESGTVEIYTHGLYQGAPLGKFKIRVAKTESDPRPPMPPERGPEYDRYIAEMQKNPPKTYTLVEKQYTRPTTTPLEIEITEPTKLTLDVGKAVKVVL